MQRARRGVQDLHGPIATLLQIGVHDREVVLGAATFGESRMDEGGGLVFTLERVE